MLDFEAALADPAIDGISLATPAEMHFEQASRGLAAGKHVLVEKPITLRTADAEVLAQLATDKGLTLMVGHLLRYHPAFVALGDLVHSGALGDMRYAYSTRQSLGKFRLHENVLWSFAPHDLSMLIALLGEPLSVTAQGNVSFVEGIADFVTMQAHFSAGVSGHVQVSWMHPFKEQRLVVIGSKGMAVFEDSQSDWGRKLAIYGHQVDSVGGLPTPKSAPVEYIDVVPGEPLLEECRHFVECIDKGLHPLTDGAEAIAVLRTLERAEKALADNLKLQSRSEK
jgi:UDP-2-acetamido-3-amino-2,3-dideoxy-glucuronate N-acetyltransferase